MKRVECLDGLRGLAALWVFIGHAMALTGWSFPILKQPNFGVDLFILLSGFLMMFQYQLRSKTEDWSKPAIWLSFWIRRFCRIAPLFYVILAVALFFGPQLYADRTIIDTFVGKPHQDPTRYLDDSFTNIFVHLTFIFGLLPDYAFRTPLPDWSLGLEMQFYAVFPFFVLLARKIGFASAAILTALTGVAAAYVAMQLIDPFPMPSFLPLKMHMFLAGMLLAADCHGSAKRRYAYLFLAVILAALPSEDRVWSSYFIREALVIVFFLLVHLRSIAIIDWTSKALGSFPMRWLGELSFGAYLIHLLIMQPVAAWAIVHGSSPFARFLLVISIVLPITYFLALATYFLVERPGNNLGKTIIRRTMLRREVSTATMLEPHRRRK